MSNDIWELKRLYDESLFYALTVLRVKGSRDGFGDSLLQQKVIGMIRWLLASHKENPSCFLDISTGA